ncbi:MAG: DUF2845 domain-containing protein [Pseudomonadota bacterium]
MKKILVSLTVLTCLGLPAAHAESLRCKGDLIDVGDTKVSAMRKCGEPVMKDSFCKPGATVPNGMGCETVEEWTYNPGYGQFLTTLRFEGGKIVSIKYGDRIK